MSYCETNPGKLQKLNDEVKAKPNRPLGFYPSPIYLTDEFFASKFSPKDPYHSDKGYPYTYKPGGNYLGRPFLSTNLHLGTTWGTNLYPFRPKFCQIMERDYLRCLSRVGVQNSDKHCRVYWEDLMECTTYEKSKKRLLFMEKVRKQKKMAPMEPPPFTAIPRP
ncbi:hypothetical protein ACTXT7_014718 [Hymenolepis weldensis]